MRFENRYGPLQRLFHDFAFRIGFAQRALADLEDILYQDRLSEIEIHSPVFITALPRSGTTILLKLLAETGAFATHTYRDMPFVLCPLAWNQFSRRFATDDEPMERAHGDGLEVSVDSPEAFEEMIWKEFWPEYYKSDRIETWDGSRNEEFEGFLERHMRKVIVLRREGTNDDRRYLSKNNLNVARLANPPLPLRSGLFLIPFRNPLQQAASMLAQHRRFLEIHAEDGFVRRYMEAIGHHEFGATLRPVNFDNWLDTAPSPEGIEFWVQYWIAAYNYILRHLDSSIRLISYKRLTQDSRAALSCLAGEIGISNSVLVPKADTLHPPREHEVEFSALPSSTVNEARQLYAELEERAAI